MLPKFEYLTFLCEQESLQETLTPLGLEGWRLHTCDPVLPFGAEGSGVLHVLVVLDRVILPGEEPEEGEGGDTNVAEAMAARG